MLTFQTGSSSVLDGLGSLVLSHPIATIGTVSVAGIGIAYSAYQNYKQNLITSAHEATSAWQDQNSTLESQKRKYIELKDLLNSGDLDETQTLDVKMQILDIQNQIVGAYENEASNLDLVNGKLSDQLALIGQISQKEARKNTVYNRKGYKFAEEQMISERSYQIGALGLDPQKGGVTVNKKHPVDNMITIVLCTEYFYSTNNYSKKGLIQLIV